MQRHVEHVEPDHRLVAIVTVLVPAHARREHQVAKFHRAFLAIDQRDGARSFEQEAQRIHGMAVGAGRLAWQQALQRRQHVAAGVFVGQRCGHVG